jgi:hypothetical protein
MKGTDIGELWIVVLMHINGSHFISKEHSESAHIATVRLMLEM